MVDRQEARTSNCTDVTTMQCPFIHFLERDSNGHLHGGTQLNSTKHTVSGPCTADEVIQAAYGLMAFDMGPMMHLGYRAPEGSGFV